MKAVTRKTNHFPGDVYIAIDVKLDDGRSIQPFGVWPRYTGGKRWYECDSGGYFNSLTEAKRRAISAVCRILVEA